MKKNILQSCLMLLYLDYLMWFRGFGRLHSIVKAEGARTSSPQPSREQNLIRAMDLACVLYFKPVLCLQRSAATTLLLRRHGWKASMIIGAKLLPFQSHAWVEIDGRVINDKPYVREMFQVLETY